MGGGIIRTGSGRIGLATPWASRGRGCALHRAARNPSRPPHAAQIPDTNSSGLADSADPDRVPAVAAGAFPELAGRVRAIAPIERPALDRLARTAAITGKGTGAQGIAAKRPLQRLGLSEDGGPISDEAAWRAPSAIGVDGGCAALRGEG